MSDPWSNRPASFAATVWDVLTWLAMHDFVDRPAWVSILAGHLSGEAALKAWERLPANLASVGAPVSVRFEPGRGNVLRATKPPLAWLLENLPDRFDIVGCFRDPDVNPAETAARLEDVRLARRSKEARMFAQRQFQRMHEERADPRRSWPTT